MLNATHSKWLPVFKTQPIAANQGQNLQTTTTKNQTRVLPTTTSTTNRRTNTSTPISTTNRQQNQQQSTTTKQFIQLKSLNSPRSGRTILVKRPQAPPQEKRPKPLFLRNCEILSQESLEELLNQNQVLNQTLNRNNLLNRNKLLYRTQLLNQTQLLKQTQLLNPNQKNLLNQSNQSAINRSIPRERLIQLPIDEEDQETSESLTPIYSIIRVPFLSRTLLPTYLVKQRKLNTNDLVKTEQVVANANGNDNQKVIYSQGLENSAEHLNLLYREQLKKQQNKSKSNQLNIATEKNLNTTPTINLNTTTTTTPRIPITTTSSGTMMGIQLPGNEFQDMNGALQIAAVEGLMTPVCLDDYLIETNNNFDFNANKDTDKLNEMTINQMNEMNAVQLQSSEDKKSQEEGQQQLMNDVPGEELYLNLLRTLNSEELISLSQHEILESESLFTQQPDLTTIYNNNHNEIFINCEDSENPSSISPSSPVPTEMDCIATSELHNHKYMMDMEDDETTYRMQFSPEQSSSEPSPVCNTNQSDDIEEILKQLISTTTSEQPSSVKRKSNQFANSQMEILGAKKSKLSLPLTKLVTNIELPDGLVTRVPDTPDLVNMVDIWSLDGINNIPQSYSSSPSWSGTLFDPNEFTELLKLKFEDPQSIVSTYTCDETSYATPSPSCSSCTIYSTNPNSPATSTYGGNGSSKKPRGRPPKQHSDLPDPSIWNRLPESERKRYEDRCKNNEASRQSRQKNKEKQNNLLREEEVEQQKNDELKAKRRAVERQHDRLKKILKRVLEK